MIEAPEIFARVYSNHGHRCPMSTLGVRLGLAAVELGFAAEQGLRAVYHSRTCALDGIAQTLGCSEELGSLAVTTEGRHCLEVYATDGQVAEFTLSTNAMRIAGEFRQLSVELEKEWDSLDEDAKSEREQRREAALDALLPGLWQAPTADLIDIRTGAAEKR